MYTLEGINNEGTLFEKTVPYIMAVLILIGVLFFLFFEFVVALRAGLDYFVDVFNYIDLTSFALNIYLIYHALNHNYGAPITS